MDEQQTTCSVSTAARMLNLSAQRIRQLCANGTLTYDDSPLGRLVHVASVGRLLVERRQNGKAYETRGDASVR